MKIGNLIGYTLKIFKFSEENCSGLLNSRELKPIEKEVRKIACRFALFSIVIDYSTFVGSPCKKTTSRFPYLEHFFLYVTLNFTQFRLPCQTENLGIFFDFLLLAPRDEMREKFLIIIFLSK